MYSWRTLAIAGPFVMYKGLFGLTMPTDVATESPNWAVALGHRYRNSYRCRHGHRYGRRHRRRCPGTEVKKAVNSATL